MKVKLMLCLCVARELKAGGEKMKVKLMLCLCVARELKAGGEINESETDPVFVCCQRAEGGRGEK